ncbi:MAG: flagellin, partial [Paracoccus sp. (in: a-proteobacteria)]|nr:flagellin [Paracoccus sp. (in: a-proteobacteria)]
IASLRSALVGANTISDVTSALDQWFEDPIASPGFFESAYSGSDSRLTPMLLDGGEVITLQPTAASDGIRTTLKGLALGALIADGTLEMDPNMQSALTRQTGLWLSEGANQMIQMRTQLGQIEETIARTATSVESERAVITIAINDMTSADPYETAARVTETENQMQLLYALTARLSRLTLADYLR